jgi:hypothetical protein
VLLGIITQPEEAQWHLEDLTGSIRLDLSQVDDLPFDSILIIAVGSNLSSSIHRGKYCHRSRKS